MPRRRYDGEERARLERVVNSDVTDGHILNRGRPARVDDASAPGVVLLAVKENVAIVEHGHRTGFAACRQEKRHAIRIVPRGDAFPVHNTVVVPDVHGIVCEQSAEHRVITMARLTGRPVTTAAEKPAAWVSAFDGEGDTLRAKEKVGDLVPVAPEVHSVRIRPPPEDFDVLQRVGLSVDAD